MPGVLEECCQDGIIRAEVVEPRSSRRRWSCWIKPLLQNTWCQMLITDRIRNKKDQSCAGMRKNVLHPGITFLKKQLFHRRNTSIIMDSIF